MSTHKEGVTRIIACAVFRPALDHLQLELRYPGLVVTYLPSNMHLRPQIIKDRLKREVEAAQRMNERVMVLYGDCFPCIDEFCGECGVVKLPGHYCYEMLLGTDRFEELIEETTGTYFAERDLVLNFQECCAVPLELDDEEMRKYCFGNYTKLLFVQQPSDEEVLAKASEIAEFLGLSLAISEADYTYLETEIIKLL